MPMFFSEDHADKSVLALKTLRREQTSSYWSRSHRRLGTNCPVKGVGPVVEETEAGQCPEGKDMTTAAPHTGATGIS
jgi:hypothetical protein